MTAYLLEWIVHGRTVGQTFHTGSSLRRYVAQRGITYYTVSEVTL